MKKEYKVISGRGDLISDAKKELEESVNDFLSSGWELVGGVSTMYDTDIEKYHFTQAVVRVVR